MKTPKLYLKKDGKYYFTFKGKQYYGGKSLEKAQAKLREVTGLAPSGDTDLVALIGQYLDSLVGSQSPDTIYGKAGTYKRMLAHLSGQEINGNGGPGSATRARRIAPLLACPQDDTHGSGLGKIRWVVEVALSWFNNHRRLRMCYERTGEHFLAFHQLAAALICFNKLGNETTCP